MAPDGGSPPRLITRCAKATDRSLLGPERGSAAATKSGLSPSGGPGWLRRRALLRRPGRQRVSFGEQRLRRPGSGWGDARRDSESSG